MNTPTSGCLRYVKQYLTCRERNRDRKKKRIDYLHVCVFLSMGARQRMQTRTMFPPDLNDNAPDN